MKILKLKKFLKFPFLNLGEVNKSLSSLGTWGLSLYAVLPLSLFCGGGTPGHLPFLGPSWKPPRVL